MKTFEELGVCEEIRRAIEELGFTQPMPVQEEVIPYLLGSRNDVIALAQTGTGKTAAFGIPVLQRIDPSRMETQALILSPTRELCLQIADDLRDFSKYMPGIHIEAVYGGASIAQQIRALKHGAHIIVATPGRLIDLMNRAAQVLMQYNDFTSFAKLHTQVKTNICHLSLAEWTEEEGGWVFAIRSNRFLRNMVRSVTGTLLDVGRGKLSIDGMREIIEKKDRCAAGVSMPACGLFLTKVEYPYL